MSDDEESLPSILGGLAADDASDAESDAWQPPAVDDVLMGGGWASAEPVAQAKPAAKAKAEDDGVSTGLSVLGSVEEQRRVARMEDAARHDMYDTQTHLQLVNALKPHVADDDAFAALRAARERMAVRCALSPRQWIEWILQEKARAGEDVAKMRYVCGLLQQATQEFHSVLLHIECCSYHDEMLTEEGDQDDEESEADDGKRIEVVRNLYEAAIRKVGTDFAQCHLLWKSYIAFWEEEMDDGPELAATKAKLYRRLSCIPHEQVGETAEDFEQWVASEPPLNDEAKKDVGSATRALRMAKALAEERRPFEEKLRAASKAVAAAKAAQQQPADKGKGKVDARQQAWMEYLAFEERKDASRALTLAERAIAEMPWVAALWQKEIEMQTTLGERAAAVETARRAVRSMPRNAVMWVEILRSVERCREMSFRDAVQPATEAETVRFKTPAEVRLVALEFLAFGRRAAAADSSFKGDVDAQCRRVYGVLARDAAGLASAAAVHAAVLGGTADAVCTAYGAALKAVPASAEEAEAVEAAVWLGYARSMQTAAAAAAVADEKERRERVRKVFEEGCGGGGGYAVVGALAAEWLEYERVCGTASSIDKVRTAHGDAIKRHANAEERRKAGVHEAPEGAESMQMVVFYLFFLLFRRLVTLHPPFTFSTGKHGKKRKSDDDDDGDAKRRRRDRSPEAGGEAKAATGDGPQRFVAFLWNVPFQAEEEDLRGFLEGVEVLSVWIPKRGRGAPQVCRVVGLLSIYRHKTHTHTHTHAPGFRVRRRCRRRHACQRHQEVRQEEAERASRARAACRHGEDGEAARGG